MEERLPGPGFLSRCPRATPSPSHRPGSLAVPLTTTSSKMLCSCVSIWTISPAFLGHQARCPGQARDPAMEVQRAADACRKPQLAGVGFFPKRPPESVPCLLQGPANNRKLHGSRSAGCPLITKPAETRDPVRWFRLCRSAAREPDESARKWKLEPKSPRGPVGCRPPLPGWSGNCFLLGADAFARREENKLETQGLEPAGNAPLATWVNLMSTSCWPSRTPSAAWSQELKAHFSRRQGQCLLDYGYLSALQSARSTADFQWRLKRWMNASLLIFN